MTYFFGDWMLYKSENMRGFNYFFNGANEVDGKWHVNLSFSSNEGYAGGATNIELQVSHGEIVRLSNGMKARIKVDGALKEKKKNINVLSMQFMEIEKDRIKVYFDQL